MLVGYSKRQPLPSLMPEAMPKTNRQTVNENATGTTLIRSQHVTIKISNYPSGIAPRLALLLAPVLRTVS
jgi:hypothetical protein